MRIWPQNHIWHIVQDVGLSLARSTISVMLPHLPKFEYSKSDRSIMNVVETNIQSTRIHYMKIVSTYQVSIEGPKFSGSGHHRRSTTAMQSVVDARQTY